MRLTERQADVATQELMATTELITEGPTSEPRPNRPTTWIHVQAAIESVPVGICRSPWRCHEVELDRHRRGEGESTRDSGRLWEAIARNANGTVRVPSGWIADPDALRWESDYYRLDVHGHRVNLDVVVGDQQIFTESCRRFLDTYERWGGDREAQKAAWHKFMGGGDPVFPDDSWLVRLLRGRLERDQKKVPQDLLETLRPLWGFLFGIYQRRWFRRYDDERRVFFDAKPVLIPELDENGKIRNYRTRPYKVWNKKKQDPVLHVEMIPSARRFKPRKQLMRVKRPATKLLILPGGSEVFDKDHGEEILKIATVIPDRPGARYNESAADNVFDGPMAFPNRHGITGWIRSQTVPAPDQDITLRFVTQQPGLPRCTCAAADETE